MSTSDGSTADYYKLPEGATELQHLISHRDMNAQIGEIFRACYRYGQASHSDQMRDAKKILFYAKAEVERLEKYSELAAQCSEVGVVMSGSDMLDLISRTDLQEAQKELQKEPRYDWSKAPEWANYVAQDSNGAWYWYAARPVANVSGWSDGGGRFKRITDGEPNLDWRDTLEQRPGTDGWIPWHGGECPVGGGVIVTVRLLNGRTINEYPAEHFQWDHNNLPSDIIAYKVVK